MFAPCSLAFEKFAAYKSVAMPLIDPSTGQPDASGVMVNVSVKSYALANYAGMPVGLRDKFAHDPLFPKFALTLFDRMLGPAFILTGLMLIVGLGTRVSLLVQGLLFIALTVGLVSDRCERWRGLPWHSYRSGGCRVFARPAQQVCGA